MSESICAPWPNYSPAEAEIIQNVLLSNKVNYWTGGKGKEFERRFAETMECPHAIALSNGTLALDLALVALDVGVGDEVVVTPRSFIASASAVHNCGAKPVFADVDICSQNLTAESIEAVLTSKTKAIICVHLAGWPCDMKPIQQLAELKGLSIIEDCAQAHGAVYEGRSVGNFCDVAAWSFCQDKIVTTGGEGGAVTTNNDALFEKMWAYKDHGKSRSKMENPKKNNEYKFVHDNFGTNFRLTEMQAALGTHQLDLLKSWTEERHNNAMAYHDALSQLGIVRSYLPPDNVVHAYYKYYCFIESKYLASGWDRDRIVEEVHELGGSCISGICPEIYKEQCFVAAYDEQAPLPNAHKLGQESLMLTVHPGITSEYLQRNIDILTTVLKRASL
jgi:dTDP-4-amino-4,6-dideoxygalactose transaminase